jgi:transcription elongation factor GreA
MIMEKYPMTLAGYEKLQVELRTLKTEERPAVITAIAEAKEHGDLKENAEYHAARERQGFIEARIKDLEGKISRAEIVDPKKLSGDTVTFGATVTVADDDGNEATYQIVGMEESDLSQGRLSSTAPLARALIGKKSGDYVEVPAPGGVKGYEVVRVVFV